MAQKNLGTMLMDLEERSVRALLRVASGFGLPGFGLRAASSGCFGLRKTYPDLSGSEKHLDIPAIGFPCLLVQNIPKP